MKPIYLRITALLLCAVSAGAHQPLTSGLVAYYPFETDLRDQTTNGLHLTSPSGNPEAGWLGGAVNRSGAISVRTQLLVGACANLVDADADVLRAGIGSGPTTTVMSTYNLGSAFTISAWHYLAPLPSNTSTRFFVFEAQDNYDISWGISAGNTYVAYNGQAAGFSTTLATDAWHHVVHCFTTDVDTIYMTVYVNGTNIGTMSTSATNMDFARINLGNARDAAGDRRWDGLLDEVAIWGRMLEPLEVAELHARGRAGQALNLATGLVSVLLSTSPASRGTVSGSGIFPYGTAIGMTATAARGYAFSRWSAPFADQPAIFQPVLTQSIELVAFFAPDLSDPDGDHLSTYEEVIYLGTDENNSDTDGDGLTDDVEINQFLTNPLVSDAGRIARIASYYAASNAGSLAASRLTIDRTNGNPRTRFALSLSTNGVDWHAVDLAGPGSSLQVTAEQAVLEFPVPAPGPSVYLLKGAGP